MKKHYIFLFLAGILFIFAGCGGGGSSDAPAESRITISPSSYSVKNSSYWDVHRKDFLITVKDPNGVPLRDVDLRISFIWASPDGRFQTLFYDLASCGDGIRETPLAQLNDGNNPKDSPMTVKTDENGSFILNLDFLSGGVDFNCDGAIDLDADSEPIVLEWNADIQVISGSVFGSAEFTVEAFE